MAPLSKPAKVVLALLLICGQLSTIHTEEICSTYCDGRDPTLAKNPRSPVNTTVWSRVISLHFSDEDNMAYGQISNGNPGDEIWIDRSFNAGSDWSEGSKLGDTQIPDNAQDTKTLMYNVDGVISAQQIGAMRACGKAGDRDEIACTSWARSTQLASTRIDAAATALMQFYNSEGVFSENGWWTSANGLTAIIDYIRLTGNKVYDFAIDYTFEKNKDKHWGNFTNDYTDDVGWWALAWVDAYDLTGNKKYLDMAQLDADFMFATFDQVCNGGIYWTVRLDYKNAISNELFIKLAAALHNRIPGDTKYLTQALNIWQWFEASGIINSDNLINDGLNTQGDCKNNGQTTWTYNQGVILGGLIQLFEATGEEKYLEKARLIADAVLASPLLNPDGILREPCEGDGCGADGPTFKGVFVRNLGELNRALDDRPYATYLERLSDIIYERNRNSLDQYGLHYAGPIEYLGSSTQQSAFEVFVAAIP